MSVVSTKNISNSISAALDITFHRFYNCNLIFLTIFFLTKFPKKRRIPRKIASTFVKCSVNQPFNMIIDANSSTISRFKAQANKF